MYYTSRKDNYKPLKCQRSGWSRTLSQISEAYAARRKEGFHKQESLDIVIRISINKNNGFQTQVQILIFVSNLKLTLIKRNTLKLLGD